MDNPEGLSEKQYTPEQIITVIKNIMQVAKLERRKDLLEGELVYAMITRLPDYPAKDILPHGGARDWKVQYRVIGLNFLVHGCQGGFERLIRILETGKLSLTDRIRKEGDRWVFVNDGAYPPIVRLHPEVRKTLIEITGIQIDSTEEPTDPCRS